MAENHILDFKMRLYPLSCIEIDPDNPRRMKLSPEELLVVLEKQTIIREIKELESLQELSWSINKKDLLTLSLFINEQTSTDLLLVSADIWLLLANKKEIEARIYKVSPNEQDLKLVQWIENTVREDLCLADKLANIESIINVMMKEGEKN